MAEALGVAGSVVGIVSLGIQVAQELLKYYDAWKDRDTEVSNMCMSLENLLGTLVALRPSIESLDKCDMSVREAVEKNIQSTKAGINELSDELQKVVGLRSPKQDLMRRHMRKALYPFKQPTLLKIKGVISDACSNLGISLQALQLNLTLATHQNIDKLVRWQEDKEKRRILDWLSSKNFRLTQNDVYGQKQPKTGQWLFNEQEFLDWEEGKISTPLWCVGSPGVGKTVLSSAVVEFLEQDLAMQKVGVAFVYCDHKSNDVQKHEYFICAIIRQLIERRQVIPEDVQALYKDHIKTQSRPSSDEYLKSLRSLSNEYSEVYIVIDALDECINKDREMIWNQLIIDLKNYVTNLRLLCTSRDIDSTGTVLSGLPCIKIQAIDKDMEVYIQEQIKSSVALKAICREDPNLETKILRIVVAKAEGMFLAAKLHINVLASQSKARAVRKALNVLPKDIDEIYDQTMERIQQHRQKDLAMQTLMWIVYATRPLAITEVQHAIAIDDLEPDDRYITQDLLTPPDVIASVCEGLIKVDKESRIIGLVHKTTQEYFDRKGADHFPGAKLHIGISCLKYLSLLEAPLIKEEYYDYARKYTLVEYVAENLAHHARGESDRRLLDLASQVFVNTRTPFGCLFYLIERQYSSWWTSQYEKGFLGIHYASFLGLESIIKRLMEDPAININLQDREGRTPLLWASKNRHEGVVKLLLEIGKVDVDLKDNYSRTPLSWASINGHEVVVKLLLETGKVDIDSKDSGGRTPLLWASENGSEGVVKLLLETSKVDVDLKDSGGRTPLLWASANGCEGVVKLLLETGKVDVDSKDNEGRTPLSWASANGREGVVKLLLETGNVDVDSKDNEGRTPLLWASINGREGVVKLLLETSKVDVDLKDSGGRTPLSWASENGSEEVVKLLLETGKVDVDSKDNYVQTPLSWASAIGHEVVVKLLLEKGADPNWKNVEGDTSLILAASKGNEDVVKLLLEKGVDPHWKNVEGDTALMNAARCGKEAVVKLLLERGADPNLGGDGGSTALILAAIWGHEATAKLLLEKGAESDPNWSDNAKNTELIWAVRWGNEAVVKLLLEKGADPNWKNVEGDTALSIATRWNRGNIFTRRNRGNIFTRLNTKSTVKLLLEAGKTGPA